MDRGTFAPEAHATADMEEPGDEFDHDGLQPNESEILPKGELELRDAAPGRALVDPKHEKTAA
jgi:hypothetical protein